MATFHETFYTFTINGPLQQQQNPIKCRCFALIVEKMNEKDFVVLKCSICKKINPNLTTPYFQEVGGVLFVCVEA